MSITSAQFDDIWSLRKQILHKFDRLEIRACNLAFGDKTDALKLMSEFFGVATVIAPRCTSFYLPAVRPPVNPSLRTVPPAPSKVQIPGTGVDKTVVGSGQRFFPDQNSPTFFLRVMDPVHRTGRYHFARGHLRLGHKVLDASDGFQ